MDLLANAGSMLRDFAFQANNHELKQGLDAFTKVKSSVPDEAVGWLDHVLA